MTLPTTPRLLITGGGTGGHIHAGIAIAQELRSKNPEAAILFVGAAGGLEETLVPKYSIPLSVVKIGTLNRVSRAQKIRTLIQLPFAVLKAFYYILRFRPQGMVGVGGYVSGPVLMAGVLLSRLGFGIRTGILEQNAVPGMTNRLLGKWVQSVFTSFPLPNAPFDSRKVLFTGNPVRKNLHRLESRAGALPTLLIVGGSQGARGLNHLILEAAPALFRAFPGLKIRHQTGKVDYDAVVGQYLALGVPMDQISVEVFIEDMVSAYRDATLVVCRSGSSTLSELATVGRASVLVPLPTAADNHQEKNARHFEAAGASRVFLQAAGEGEKLAGWVIEILRSPEIIQRMEQQAVTLAVSGCESKILHELKLL
jgi:UDP-N-acetylglucosamine--N-acetylmuramyl-(pentapeptide) pyrophosphoryl-undecaprenol N-acetylglucosamine transferase